MLICLFELIAGTLHSAALAECPQAAAPSCQPPAVLMARVPGVNINGYHIRNRWPAS